MRPRRATQGAPIARTAQSKAAACASSTAPAAAIQSSHQQGRGRASARGASPPQQVAQNHSACRGVVRQSSVPASRAASASAPSRSSPVWRGSGKFGAASLRASPGHSASVATSSASSPQQAEIPPKACDGASSPRMGGALLQPGSPNGSGLRSARNAVPKNSEVNFAIRTDRPDIRSSCADERKTSIAPPSMAPSRAGSTTPTRNQGSRSIPAGSQVVASAPRSCATSPQGGTRSPAPPSRVLATCGPVARPSSPQPQLSWRAPSPPRSPGSPSMGGAAGRWGLPQATSSYQPLSTQEQPVPRCGPHRFTLFSPSGEVQVEPRELVAFDAEEVRPQPIVQAVHPSAGSRSPSPKGNVSWRVVPPSGSGVGSSLEGVTTAPLGPLRRQMVGPALRVSRGAPSQTMPNNGFQASSPSASPVQTMRIGKPAQSTVPVPTTFLGPCVSTSTTGACVSTSTTAASEGRWRPPWFDDSSDSAWTAAEELQAAATNMGLLGDGDALEHKWFFDGLQKGFAKKAKSEEQEALAEVRAREEAAEAALARCREELRVGAEQRAALEEVLTASQASRDEMTQMVAEVAEVKQRMTEEMAQQALDVGMVHDQLREMSLSARDALNQQLHDKHQLQDLVVHETEYSALVNETEVAEEEDSVCLLANSRGVREEQAFVTFRDVELPLYTEECLRSFSLDRLHRHAMRLVATLSELLQNPVIPEAPDDIVLWILYVQREHLEILPELEKLLRNCEWEFDHINDSSCNQSAVLPSPLGARLRSEPPQTPLSDKAAPISVQPEAVAPTLSSPSAERRDTSQLSQNTSKMSTPESKTRQTSPLVIAMSPAVVSRSSPIRLSAARTSPATSTRSGMSPLGSARKLSDNAIRSLPAPVANFTGDNIISLKLADRLGTGSPPVGPVRLNTSGPHGCTYSRRN